ncbi:MAG: AraC family transcriptional regulator [Ruminococcaceae bacterium]|nr:AraC family transcriptional regulator [Oscillospiraceae bacterium]
MNNKHNVNYMTIKKGEFYIESLSSAHRYIDPPNVYIRYANEHRHDRLVCIISGKCKFDIFNDKPIIAKKGDIIYIPYNIAYRTEWETESRGEVYSINYVMNDRDSHQITICPEICSFSNCDSFLTEGIFKECCYTFEKEETGFLLKCKYILMKLLYTIVLNEEQKSNSKIGKALDYININYLDDISISELASMCNLGECMFRRCFKAETGISPIKYRNKLRIEKAYELLTNESHSISDVMEMTGFYDASYFNKTFKHYIGKSPSECRRPKHLLNV